MLLLRMHRELCVCELVSGLDESQSKVSRHLAQLRNCGLLQDRRQGQWVFYSLCADLPDWMLGVLDLAGAAEDAVLREMQQRLETMADRPERLSCKSAS
jgi:ArsR family transcriptional regulator